MGVIQGNAYIESVSYSLSNGATPSTCQIALSALSTVLLETPVTIFVGGSQWRGRVVDARDIKSESVGQITQVRAVDYRDDLAGRTVFGQFNMIDRDDGSIYQINELVSGDDWVNQVVVEGHLSPREILDFLSAAAGFTNAYSDSVSNILYSSDADWRATIYNVFNLDWNTGIKVHAAMQQICTLLGIQFTIMMTAGSDRVLRFTVIGDPDYPGIEWEGFFATDSEVGLGINLEVDTGVWVVGDRQLNQYVDLDTEPAWSQAWNTVFWDTLLLADMLASSGLDEFTNTVMDWANYFGSQYKDAGFVQPAKFFNDFTIKEYLRTVPFKVYRLIGMDAFLTPDEFNGIKRVRINPIVTPLVSDPGVQYEVKAASVKRRTKKVSNPLKVSSTVTKQQSGSRLIESSGHIIFDLPRFQIDPTAVAAKKTYLKPSDLLPDSPTVTCVFLGDVYRNFFGTNDRIGTKHVPNLRIAKIIDFTNGNSPDNYPEFTVNDEKTADQTAADIATGYLWRDRVVKSGKETFKGIAGHYPTGEISRISVSLTEGGGISEEVNYSSDEPSFEYDPQIEQRRRIGQEALRREQEKLRTTTQRNHIHEQRLEFGGHLNQKSTDFHDDHLIDAALGALNKDGWAQVKNTDGAAYVVGQPIVGKPDPTDKQFASTAVASIADGEKNILGICAYPTTSQNLLAAVVHGPGQALVFGPVSKGDSLVYDATNKALKKGDGGNCIAMDDQSTAAAVLTPVRIGAGAGGSSVVTVVNTISTTNQASLTGLALTIDNVPLNTDGMTVLLQNQTTATQNGVWTVHSGAWTKVGQPTIVAVISDPALGAANNLTIWELTTTNTYTQVPFGTTCVIVTRIGTTSVSSGGTPVGPQTIDGAAAVNNSLYLMQAQSTSANRGVWKAQTGAGVNWIKNSPFLPTFVFATAGSVNQFTLWVLSTPASNSYTAVTGVYS